MKELSSTSVDDRKTTFQNMAYALPKLSLYLLITGPMTILPGMYAKYFGMSLAAIALARFIARIFDGITDPITGYLSDRFQQRYGTRKPMIAVGGLLVLVSSSMLYIPYGWDAQNPEPVHFAYFLGFYMAFGLAWNIMDMPHLAWGAEISSDTKGRSQRFSFRSIATYSASIIFFAIPLLPAFESTEVTYETLEYSVYLAWVLMPLCLWVCLHWVPNGPASQTTAQAEHAQQQLSKKQRIQQIGRLVIGNKPLLVFYAVYAFIGVGYTMSNSLTFFFVDNYLGLAEMIPYVFLAHYSIGVISSWVWGLVAQKIGARPTWAIGMSMCLIGLLGIGFVSPSEGSFWFYLICKILIGAGYLSTFVVGYMVLADIADYGRWKFREECGGLYFSLRATVAKFNMSIGGALSLVLVEWLGFEVSATVMSEQAIQALRLIYIVIPSILLLVAIVLITRIPLNSHQHSVIRKRLDARALIAGE